MSDETFFTTEMIVYLSIVGIQVVIGIPLGLYFWIQSRKRQARLTQGNIPQDGRELELPPPPPGATGLVHVPMAGYGPTPGLAPSGFGPQVGYGPPQPGFAGPGGYGGQAPGGYPPPQQQYGGPALD